MDVITPAAHRIASPMQLHTYVKSDIKSSEFVSWGCRAVLVSPAYPLCVCMYIALEPLWAEPAISLALCIYVERERVTDLSGDI